MCEPDAIRATGRGGEGKRHRAEAGRRQPSGRSARNTGSRMGGAAEGDYEFYQDGDEDYVEEGDGEGSDDVQKVTPAPSSQLQRNTVRAAGHGLSPLFRLATVPRGAPDSSGTAHRGHPARRAERPRREGRMHRAIGRSLRASPPRPAQREMPRLDLKSVPASHPRPSAAPPRAPPLRRSRRRRSVARGAGCLRTRSRMCAVSMAARAPTAPPPRSARTNARITRAGRRAPPPASAPALPRCKATTLPPRRRSAALRPAVPPRTAT